MAVRYIAGKRMKVEGGVFREPGQEVPEAEHWPTLRHYVDAGEIIVEPVMEPSSSVAVSTDDPVFTDRGVELNRMLKDDLKEIASGHGVPIYGSKKDIIDRILETEF